MWRPGSAWNVAGAWRCAPLVCGQSNRALMCSGVACEEIRGQLGGSGSKEPKCYNLLLGTPEGLRGKESGRKRLLFWFSHAPFNLGGPAVYYFMYWIFIHLNWRLCGLRNKNLRKRIQSGVFWRILSPVSCSLAWRLLLTTPWRSPALAFWFPHQWDTCLPQSCIPWGCY